MHASRWGSGLDSTSPKKEIENDTTRGMDALFTYLFSSLERKNAPSHCEINSSNSTVWREVKKGGQKEKRKNKSTFETCRDDGNCNWEVFSEKTPVFWCVYVSTFFWNVATSIAFLRNIIWWKYISTVENKNILVPLYKFTYMVYIFEQLCKK